MSMPKVLFMVGYLVSTGGIKVITDLARKVSNDDYEIHFVGFNDPEHPVDVNSQLYKGLTIEVINLPGLPGTYAEKLKQHIDFAAGYLSANAGTYQTIILDSWPIKAAGIIAGISNLPKVFQLAQDDPEANLGASEDLWQNSYFKLIPFFTGNIIAVSEPLAQVFDQRYGRSHPWLHLYVDEVFHARSYTPKETDQLHFVTSGSSFTHDRVKQLIDILSRIDNSSLTIVSSSTIDKSQFTNNPVHLKVTKTQTAEDMASILAEHDVYIGTSENEAFGLSLAEAVAIGLPCIALDSVGNRTYHNGENFLMANSLDEINRYIYGLKSLELRKQLSTAAKKSMESFTLERTYKEFSEIIF